MSIVTPSYRLHKPTGQAVVTLCGRDFYLGKYGTPESKAEYDRQIAEWLANGRQLATSSGGPADLTIAELILAYFRFAEGYYRKHGEPTTEVESIRVSLRPLRALYGTTPAREFGPKKLKAVREAFVASGLCRGEVNKRVGRVVRMFKYAVENELVPASIHHGLKAVTGLRKGRSGVRESAPVKPVADCLVDAVVPHLPPPVRAMVQLQRLTGMRPGEVTIMRTSDLDMTGAVWEYVPGRHKTEHHDRERKIMVGPRAQEVLRAWLRDDPDAYLFSPAKAMEELSVERRKVRKTPLTPSQRARKRKARPKRAPGDHYTPRSYARAISRGCDLAFPHPTLAGIGRRNLTVEQRAELKCWRKAHHWHPNQLRHSAATMLRKEFGLDVARVILGHSSPVVTEVYAEVDREKARAIMGRVG